MSFCNKQNIPTRLLPRTASDPLGSGKPQNPIIFSFFFFNWPGNRTIGNNLSLKNKVRVLLAFFCSGLVRIDSAEASEKCDPEWAEAQLVVAELSWGTWSRPSATE